MQALASVEIDQVSKRFGLHRALAAISFRCEAGKLCALLGPNGAGKSTLLRILSSLARPSSGSVHYRAADGSQLSDVAARGAMGVLAHESLIYGELTGRENLEFFGRLYGLSSIAERATALLERVELDRKASDRPAKTYSRGMTQRLSLARALLHEPQFLLLDEPFTGLDRKGSALLVSVLAELRERGAICIVVSHDFEALEGITDHIVVIKRGKLVADVRAAGAPFRHAELRTHYFEHTE